MLVRKRAPQEPTGSAAWARRPTLALFVLAAAAACESTSPPVPPSAPGPPAAVPASDRQITLTWAIPHGEVTSVELERAQGDGPFAAIATLPGTATSHNDAGLSPETGYR